jgi:hypothetical protein
MHYLHLREVACHQYTVQYSQNLCSHAVTAEQRHVTAPGDECLAGRGLGSCMLAFSNPQCSPVPRPSQSSPYTNAACTALYWIQRCRALSRRNGSLVLSCGVWQWRGRGLLNGWMWGVRDGASSCVWVPCRCVGSGATMARASLFDRSDH